MPLTLTPLLLNKGMGNITLFGYGWHPEEVGQSIPHLLEDATSSSKRTLGTHALHHGGDELLDRLELAMAPHAAELDHLTVLEPIELQDRLVQGDVDRGCRGCVNRNSRQSRCFC